MRSRCVHALRAPSPAHRGIPAAALALPGMILAAWIEPASAQCTQNWVQIAATGPSAREGAYLVYDVTREVGTLFGGAGAGGVRFDDTWEWNGAAWLNRSTTPVAAPRAWGGSAYDSTRARMVLFGGNAVNNANNYTDTHEWDGSSWARVSVGVPSQRCCMGMTFDHARGYTILFGGAHLNTPFRDTWAWNGASWFRLSEAGPSVRYAPSLAHDALRRRVVFFGGSTIHGNSPMFNDTWEWDGTAWTERMPPLAPPARRLHAAAFDPVRRAVMLFGGEGTGSTRFADTWAWDGTE